MKKRSKKLLVVGGVLVAGYAAAAVPYGKLVGLQVAFRALPVAQRDKLALRVKVVHVDHADHSPIRLWVMDGAARTEIKLGPDGEMPDVPVQDWVDRKLLADTDQKPHTVQTEVDLTIRQPAGALTGGYLLDAVAQSQQAISAGARQAGGYLATLAAPTVRGVTLKLSVCCAGSASVGGLQLTQDKAGDIVIPRRALEEARGAAVVVSAPVIGIEPATD